jgi:hypothetical protein
MKPSTITTQEEPGFHHNDDAIESEPAGLFDTVLP